MITISFLLKKITSFSSNPYGPKDDHSNQANSNIKANRKSIEMITFFIIRIY